MTPKETAHAIKRIDALLTGHPFTFTVDIKEKEELAPLVVYARFKGATITETPSYLPLYTPLKEFLLRSFYDRKTNTFFESPKIHLI